MQQIKDYRTFTKIKPINKGWSNDKKYYIEAADNRRLLLRVADISEYERKKAEFEIVKKVATLGVPMSQPLDFGICDNGKSVYSLLTWCDGEDAEVVLPHLTETEQYELGVKSGEILKLIHSIPAPKEQEEWCIRFNRKTNYKIKKYKACGIKFDGDDKIINYIENNRHLLSRRPQCYQHGDYHVGNMIISRDKTLSIIDFNRPDFGDPWEEFNRIVWSAMASPHFATGQLRGYFGGEPPIEFFRLLAFYISSNTLSSIYWAVPFGEKEITTMKNQAKDVLTWFDNMNNPVPTWHLKDFYIQYIDDVPYKLKAPFDISFIRRYGEVFRVYDDQDSGNICFGVRNGGDRYFIKFAGAPTEQYTGTPDDAVVRLKATEPVYQELAHPNLIKFIKAEEVGGGFAVVFEWVDGECMGRQYPNSRQKFLQMSHSTKLNVFDDILSFHAHIIDKGYVAIDFYDGSIMYDFNTKKTIICDIDFYSKIPYINNMGRMWGSSRFMSPEEFELGATIDEITNVYLMGATAFALFGGYDRTPDKWYFSKELYMVALKAVSNERRQRQQSIQQFIEEWNEARKRFHISS
jgi:aminoglycoside phosphotransferase (APT) family kinase protein